MTNIITIIITLGILVFFHELGHLIVAKYFKIGVRAFSLGFGPKLASKKLGGTEYKLSLIPLGGYVAFKDEKTTEHVEGQTFEEASVLARILVVLAGPVANILLAFVLFFSFFWFNGHNVMMPVVGTVLPASPAEKANLQVGDTILKIAGTYVIYWEDVVNKVLATEGEPFKMVLLRNGQELTLNIEPEKRIQSTILGESKAVGFLGIDPKGPWQSLELSTAEAFIEGVTLTWDTTLETVKAIHMLILGSLPADSIGGPIMITQTISDHAEIGFTALMLLVAVISVNLAVVNMFPLPVLDGGHILMFIIEAIRGRPISESIQKNFQKIGLAIILLLMILGTYNDIMRL